MQWKPWRKKIKLFCLVFFSIFLTNCNVNSSKNKYLLAEKLLASKKYEAAIHELEQIVKNEPLTNLGKKSLHKVATIQHFYRKRPKAAKESYKLLLKRIEKDKEWTKKILRILGELYTSEFRDYNNAILVYKELLSPELKDNLADQYLFNIGRSFYLMSAFSDAVKIYRTLQKNYPHSELYTKSELEIANAFSSNGECKKAIKSFEIVTKSKDKKIAQHGSFGLALCYEELDNLDKAYDLFVSIKDTYPSPEVIDLKIKKIKRRKILRRR